MDNEEMWDKLFERVDSFKAKLEPTETDARDAVVLALYGLSFCFLTVAINHPSQARILKDGLVRSLQQVGLSRKRTEVVAEVLTSLCDVVEKTK